MRCPIYPLAWLCALLLACAQLHAVELRAGEIRPEGAAAWQAVTLPDHWSDTRPAQAGVVWYRLRVDIDRPQALLGIYLARACNNAWLYANGELLYSGGGPADGPRVRRNCHLPVLAAWPKSAQRAGANELLVRVHAEAAAAIASQQRKGHLSAVVVEDWQALQPVYAHEYRVRITLARVTSTLMGFAGFMLLVLWWWYRRERVYLYFGIAMACGALGTARVFLVDTGLDNLTVERIIPSLVVLICLGITGSLFELNDLRTRALRIWTGLAVLAIAALMLVPAEWLSRTALVAYALGALMAGATLFRVWRQLRGADAGAQRVFYGGTAIMLVTAVHDYLVQLRVLDYTDRPLIQVVLPVLLLGLMMRLMSRHVEALRIAESSRAELEQRVQLITREIEQSYAESVVLQKERAAQEERERIARDLHDDLGARLLTMVHRSQDEKASASAREALSDLRLLIGHLNAPEGTLDEALSDWRAETGQRCEAAGRELDWQCGDLPAMRLGTRQKITLGRLLREAVTNVLKHTDSPEVRVRIMREGPLLVIGVQDRAASLPAAQWKPGVGLRNLQVRAAQIGATLCWEDVIGEDGRKQGTCLHCTLPLQALDGAESGGQRT